MGELGESAYYSGVFKNSNTSHY